MLRPRNAYCDGGLDTTFTTMPTWSSTNDGPTAGTYEWVVSGGNLMIYSSAVGDTSRVLISNAVNLGDNPTQYTFSFTAERFAVPYDPRLNSTLVPSQTTYNATTLNGSKLLVGWSLGDGNTAAVCSDRPTAFTSTAVSTIGTMTTYTSTMTVKTDQYVALCIRLVAKGEALFAMNSLNFDCVPTGFFLVVVFYLL